ncbi:MAG: PAS domain S-box protein, partial [Verrucomicrobia bacterium]|nr:PAS domain S-box protein [Verrucomicrobiota bacterium]
ASEDRFRLVMDATQDGVWDWDIPSGKVYYSPAYLAMLGYQREEFQAHYHSWRDLIHREDLDHALQVNQNCIENGGDEFNFESRLRTKNGEWRWIMSRGKCVARDAQGRAVRLVGSHLDITERKRMEEALRKSEEQHRTILQAAMDGFWMVDEQGRLLDVNAAYCRMSGYSATELLAMSIADLEANQSPVDISNHIQKVIAQREDRFESRHRRKDRTVFDIEISVQYRSTEGGWFAVFLRDITARKQAEEALRLSEAEFRLVLEHSNDAIFWADAETGLIVRCNRKAEALAERSRDELIGMHVEHLHPPGPDYHEVFRRLAAVPATENVEAEFLGRTGRRTPVTVNFSVVTIGREKIVQGIARDMTDRRRAEEALRVAEEQRRLALAAGNLGTWDYDLATGAVFWDERCRCIHGLEVGKPIGYSTAFSLMHKEDRASVKRAVLAALRPEGGGIYRAEYRLLPAYGSVRWIAATGQAYFQGQGKAGKAIRFVGTVSDITTRKHADEALRQIFEEFRLVFEHSNDAVFWIDVETGLVARCNRRARELTGRNNDELLGMHQALLFPCFSVESGIVRSVADLTRTENFEAEVVSPTGKRTPVLVNCSVITVGRKRILQGICRDITERKQAEQTLQQAHDELEQRVRLRTKELSQSNASLQQEIEVRRQTEQRLSEAEFRYRTVADFTHDWEYWETPVSRLEYCSPSCLRITGYSARQFLARPGLLVEIIHPDDVSLWRNHRDALLAAGVPQDLQFRISRKDGSICWLEHASQQVVGEDGAFLGIRASNRDITDRKDTELQTQRLRQELAHMARVSTAGQLVGALAHELRQPLTGILSNSQAAERFLANGDCDLQEVKEALSDIRSDGQRARGVLQNLSEMFCKTPPKHGVVQINELLQETARLLRSEFVSQGTAVELELSAELPRVMGNAIELQQVVMNLIMNALDAMAELPHSARRVRLSTSRQDSATIQVSVTDRGPGIPQAQTGQVFEPFFTTKQNGMGMGLAICKSIIEAHDGRLWAVNNPAGGATVHFSLPITNGEEP